MMSPHDDATALQPPLALRVGITGHRRLDEEAIPRLRNALNAALGFVRDEMATFAETAEAKAVYRRENGDVPAALRVISPLAEGSDRLFVEAAIPMGASLYFPLPFTRTEYEKDFPETQDAFRALVGAGETFELDGERDDPMARDESYEAVGRCVIGASDLIVAIWDGQRARGQGGTESIVSLSLDLGTPIFWIEATGTQPPRWLSGVADFHSPDKAPSGDDAFASLRAWMLKTLSPPLVGEPERYGPFGWLASFLCRVRKWDRQPLDEYLSETPLPERAIWRAYAEMMRVVAPRRGASSELLAEPIDAVERYWRNLYDAPDRIANAYSDRYRSSYVLIALLAVVAVGAAALTGDEGLTTSWVVLAFEILAVAAIGLLVTVNQTHRWHERWISYRLLAELFRKQYALSSIGRSLPGADIVRLTSELDVNDRPPRDVWVAWYYLAVLRAAPFPVGSMTVAKARALEMGLSLIAEQKAYHQARRARSSQAGGRIKAGSEIFFGATVALAVAKFLAVYLAMSETLHVLVLAGAFLSAGAGALVGIRAYSEFTLLARQSTHMLRELEIAERDFAAAREVIHEPLSSVKIGRALYGAAGAMMQDISGWAQLFRMKTIEAG